MDPTYWGSISSSAQDLVRRMLVVNPAHRLTAEQVLSHPWLVKDQSAVPNTHLAGTMVAMKKFVARRRLRKAIAAVRLTVRMKLRIAASASLAAKRLGQDPQAAFFAGARAAGALRNDNLNSAAADFPSALAEVGRARGVVYSSVAGIPGMPAYRR
jgi:hypothetical protein